MKMLLAALKRIRDKGPIEKEKGICGNVRLLVPRKQRKEIQDKIYCLTQRWPEYKGPSLVYPVEGSGWLYRESARLGILWKNPRRIYLLNYMIKELENECSRSTEKDS